MMTNRQALDYWKWKYEAAKDYHDEHWDAEERHAHQDYVSALEYAISALEDRSKLIVKSKEQ